MNKLCVLIAVSLFVTGCSFYKNDCDEYSVSKDEIAMCFDIQKQISGIKLNTPPRLVLEERYRKECVISDADRRNKKICEAKNED